MNAPRLVAVDLDGTLVGPDLTISDADRAAIARATAASVEVCIATGRLFSAGLPYAQTLGLHGYLIPLNGAAVYDIETRAMVRSVPLDAKIAREALEAFRSAGLRVQLYFDDRLYLDGTDVRTAEYIRLSRIEPVIVPDLATLLEGAAPGPGPMKVLAIGDEGAVLAQVRELGTRFAGRANVFKSLPQYVEVTDPHAARSLDRSAVAAIGDSDNDAPMLRWAGRSYAVGNGTALAKESAKRVVAARGAGVAEAFADLLEGAAYERA